jgi:hypothetical protein
MVATYSPQELSAIAEAPMMAGLAVAMSDLGIISTAIEAAALTKEMAGAAQKYPNNTILQSVFSEEALRSGSIKVQPPQIKPEEVESGALVDKAIASLNAALKILQGKATPEEINEYKAFTYSCADAVANAAGSGLFGSGSPKVSERETVALDKIKAALA